VQVGDVDGEYVSRPSLCGDRRGPCRRHRTTEEEQRAPRVFEPTLVAKLAERASTRPTEEVPRKTRVEFDASSRRVRLMPPRSREPGTRPAWGDDQAREAGMSSPPDARRQQWSAGQFACARRAESCSKRRVSAFRRGLAFGRRRAPRREEAPLNCEVVDVVLARDAGARGFEQSPNASPIPAPQPCETKGPWDWRSRIQQMRSPEAAGRES